MKGTLAEVAGIFAGDGTLYRTNRSFVMEVRGHPDEDEYYRKYVAPFFSQVLNSKLKIIKRNYKNSVLIGIRKCGKKVYNLFHIELGFPVGKKSRIVRIPNKILNSNNKLIWISYLRGVFDTDGSIDKRFIKKKYLQPFVSFTTVSEIHKNQIYNLLKKLDFNAWKEKYRVRIAGWSSVDRFFNLIKPHNNLRIDKWNEILDMKAQVA